MIITMEEEILRAHRRATKNHKTVSACSVLMEEKLMQYQVEHEERPKMKVGGASSSGQGEASTSGANEASWYVVSNSYSRV